MCHQADHGPCALSVQRAHLINKEKVSATAISEQDLEQLGNIRGSSKHDVVGAGQQHFQKNSPGEEKSGVFTVFETISTVQSGQAMLMLGFSTALVNVVCSLPESRTPTIFL